jgi:hypothetical protein
MAETPPPGVKSRRSYNRVKIFLMLGDRVTSSSESSAADVRSHDPSPDPERVAANTFFFLQELCRGEWSLSAVLSLFQLQEAEAARRSLAIVSCKGGGIHCSRIM